MHNLKQQAKRDGGDVHILLGNHEIMTMTGDYRYLQEKYIHLSVYFRKQQKELYSARTFLGQWLRSKNVTIKIDKKIFVHGGFSPHVANGELALDTITNISSGCTLMGSATGLRIHPGSVSFGQRPGVVPGLL
ncbi:MAG: hypothetical protein U5L09_05165 [Bacteroidales bacterium]|nr:hypothetical protein [Bacteroidales bacterium]